MESKITALKQRLEEISDLNNAAALLGWDQLTHMPPGGAEARGRQSATLARIAQERQMDEALGKLIEELLQEAQSLPAGDQTAAMIRVAKIDYDRATRIPPEFVARFYQHIAQSYQVWAESRQKNDFAAVQPMLEKTLDLSREGSGFFPEAEHVADPLIDMSDYGMKVSLVRPLFAQLRAQLVPVIQAITSQPAADDACLKQHFPAGEQIAFGEKIIKQMGYDFQRGRQDKSAHPFTTRFSINDVRITTRVKEDDFLEAFFSSTHEAGHAMYEQGIDQRWRAATWRAAPRRAYTKANLACGRTSSAGARDFWVYAYPLVQEAFPAQFGNVSRDTFYRAINKVQRSLIRTDADEVTYNLHVMIRFDLGNRLCWRANWR